RSKRDWSSDVCSSDLVHRAMAQKQSLLNGRLSQAVIFRFISSATSTLQRNITKDLSANPLGKSRVRMNVVQHTLAWDNRIAVRRSEERRVGKECSYG